MNHAPAFLKDVSWQVHSRAEMIFLSVFFAIEAVSQLFVSGDALYTPRMTPGAHIARGCKCGHGE
jgi:hypothetical protein